VSPGPGPTARLPRSIAEAIARHARAERPNEACGLVVGSAHAALGGVARRYVPCRNAAASPSRYSIHRDDLLSVLRELDQTGEELWGVVHSHVRSPAVPSSTDIGEAAWPAAVYLLVSLAGEPSGTDGAASGDVRRTHRHPSRDSLPALRAWRIADGAAGELPLVIEEGGPA
jgi:proteasome lid subunit RPN8/RPN11